MTTGLVETPNGIENSVEQDRAKELIQDKVEAFVKYIESRNPDFEIDAFVEAGEPLMEGKQPILADKTCFKVLDHRKECAYIVDLDTILKYDMVEVIETLEMGLSEKLYGVTRIVGYYSRVNNWNKSKVSELGDRHKGMYGQVGKAWE